MNRIRQTLEQLRSEGNFRRIPADSTGSAMLDFTSNDYLGIASREDLQKEFFAANNATRLPLTSSASRLLAAGQNQYESLENLIGNLYGKKALLFNSGYHANTGLIPALADRDTLVLADRLVHASIIDGYVLARTEMMRFRHNDMQHLAQLLERHANGYKRVLIVVESVYSMDGDSPDMRRLAKLKRMYPNAMLYVDEAHAFGAVGSRGLGLCAAEGIVEDVDILVGTLGKAAASVGAFAVMSGEMCEYMVNRARSLIFSTALPPLNCAWSEFIIRRIAGMDAEREKLAMLSERLRTALSGLPGAQDTAASYIRPYIVGSAERAVELSQRLAEAGIKVLPIRTPTVARGTERLRISLSAAMSYEDIDRLADALHNAI